ncbi:MAG TPA: HDIG domain-containing protein [Patescibacteria group bacterium]
MIKRIDALHLLHENMQSVNLRKHCYAVEAVMKSLAVRFDEDEDLWGIAGLVHDLDYEKYPEKHPLIEIEMFEKKGFPKEVIDAIKAHAWGYREGLPEPKTKMEWSLYCCDELTGLIVAVALTRPDKKLASVELKSIKKKWKEKSFAKGVNREQIGKCKEKLGIELDDFIQIALKAMTGIADELGL